jgi:hypothetical protein
MCIFWKFLIKLIFEYCFVGIRDYNESNVSCVKKHTHIK